MKKLLILDCDWVLYKPNELDVNAMVYAFNNVCDDLNCQEYKFTHIEHCTENKPVKWFYNYIRYVAELFGINFDDFIEKMISTVDYSNIKKDSEWILNILKDLETDYEICICTNNHKKHLDKVLWAKFGIISNRFPYPIFDVVYSETEWKFYPKQSPEFLSKLERSFNIKSSNFLWIDDTPSVLEKVSELWCQCILVDENNNLFKIIKSLF